MKTVAIICAFRNEIKTLQKCLDSLVNQTYKNKELILVDDGSDDGSSEIAKEFSKKYNFVKYYKIEHLKNYGCVRPRMHGIEKANSEILFIVDADAYYVENYLELCVPHLNDKNSGVVGKIRVWNPDNFMSKYRDALYRLRYDDVENIKKEIKDNKIAAWIIWRNVYDQVGGYKINESYSEDVDLAKRMIEAGYSIIYEPEALWWHRWKDEFILSIKNNYKIGYLKGNNPKSFNLKMFYFMVFPFLVLFSFFNIYFIVLIILHLTPSIFRSFVLLFKTMIKGYENSIYSLYFLPISYTNNISIAIGFIMRLIFETKIN